MKRAMATLTMAAVMLLALSEAAGATHPEPPPANDAAAPNTEDCRPGGNSKVVGSWTMMNQEEYEAMLLADRGVSAGDDLPPDLVHPGGEDGEVDTWGELANERATATWEFCDHNDDGETCVMRQTAPSSAAAWTMSYIILDNHPFPG
jgi:hypothetical protein